MIPSWDAAQAGSAGRMRTRIKLDVDGPAGRRAHGEQLADKVRGGDDVELHGEGLEDQHLGGAEGGSAQERGALADRRQLEPLSGRDESDEVDQDRRLHLLELRGVGACHGKEGFTGRRQRRTLQAMRKHTRGR